MNIENNWMSEVKIALVRQIIGITEEDTPHYVFSDDAYVMLSIVIEDKVIGLDRFGIYSILQIEDGIVLEPPNFYQWYAVGICPYGTLVQIGDQLYQLEEDELLLKQKLQSAKEIYQKYCVEQNKIIPFEKKIKLRK